MESIHAIEELIDSGNLSEALDAISSLPQETQNHWYIQNLTGVICAYCGQFQDAEGFFLAALEQQPKDINLLYNLADTYAALEKRRKALDWLRRCEENDAEGQMAQDIAALREKLEVQNIHRVLMAAYYFPPLSGSGVFRSLKFAKYLPQFGWTPTVISADRPPIGWNFSDESQVQELPADLEVIRIPDKISTGQEDTVSAQQAQALLSFLENVLCESPEGHRIFSQIAQSREGITQLITFPCNALSWAYDVVQYIEKNIDLSDFDVIYTTSGPASAHLIGFYLKRKYGIPWVADYRDPWTFNSYGIAYDPVHPGQRLRFELESTLLHSADASLTVVKELVDSYEKNFGLQKGKVFSITNGYDEADFASLSLPRARTEKFTINYSGLIYADAQSITSILEALKQLIEKKKIDQDNVVFRLVGLTTQDMSSIGQQFGLENIIVQTGYLSHREALQSNLDADMLLLLVGDDPKYKPVYTGKIFEYLRSGRPILALAPKGGVVDEVLRETGHGEAMLSTQISKIKAMILREYRRWETGDMPELLHSPKIERFERRGLTEQLAQVFRSIIARGKADEAENAAVPAQSGTGTVPAQKKKYLVICNGGYPSEGDPRCMFAHKRVLQYIKAGLDVDAFGFIWGAPLQTYTYQGVEVTQGGVPELQKVLQSRHYEKLLIHFVDAAIMYAIQEAKKLGTPMIIWGHGYEMLRWNAVYFNYSPEEIQKNKPALEKTDKEKKDLLAQLFSMEHIHFVFVSDWMKERVKRSVGKLPLRYSVIHNFIDCDFYQSNPKCEKDRMKVLSIKSHTTKMYANDITANAILELSDRSCFSEMEFELYGSGPLFSQNFGKLAAKKFPNVHLYDTFLSAEEMKALFDTHGILIAPTRRDTQGVTTCEAMSAGLAVISCNTSAIPEFVDENCGSLYEFDNYFQLADEIEYLYYHPEEFLRKSKNAVERVRKQCGYDATIKRELELITET